MRTVLLFLIIAISLIGADLNTTLIKENNLTLYQQTLNELNVTSADYKLQKTLINKITKLLSTPIHLPKKEDFKVKDDDAFVKKFLLITDLLVQTQVLQEENEQIKEQLEDIKDEISHIETNSSNYLTLNLEYAYYYKKELLNSQIIQQIESNYIKWLDLLLQELPKITFIYSKQKVALYKTQLAHIDKKIHKYTIEKERYLILENERSLQWIEQKLQKLRQKKQKLIKNIVAQELKRFFKALKEQSPQALKIEKEILSFLKQEKEIKFHHALQITTSYVIQKIIGSKEALFLTIKEEVLTFLNKNSLLGIPLYKFAEALGIFLLFLFFRKLFAIIVLRTFHSLTKATKTTIDDKLIELLEGPLKFAFIIIGLYFAFKTAGIENDISDKIIKTLIIYVLFWLLFNLVNVLDETIYKFARKFGKELYREIGAFFIKTLKIFIFAIGLVSILQEWDINVSAFIASLGLGGLAFALAAKDTAANLFGGLSILADRALKIDDWIKVGSVEGTVEDIGLRTTKIRTFEKSLVTVPNQYIANNPIENFSRRNIRRIKMRIGLVYSTTSQQMEAILKEIKNMLQSHPGIAQDATLLVNFDEFGSSELSIFIYCFTNTANWAKYLEIREDINLKIMQIVHDHGSDFAFPSESLYIEKVPEDLWKK